jgi:dolichol kinase
MSRSNGGRDSFDRLLTDGSQASRTKDAKQKQGALPVWLLLSFLVSLVFPLFWVVFVLIFCASLVYWGREWMG